MEISKQQIMRVQTRCLLIISANLKVVTKDLNIEDQSTRPTYKRKQKMHGWGSEWYLGGLWYICIYACMHMWMGRGGIFELW